MDPFAVATHDHSAFLNALWEHKRVQKLLTTGMELAAGRGLALKCIRVKPPPAGQWHDPRQSASFERLAAATWFMASGACS